MSVLLVERVIPVTDLGVLKVLTIRDPEEVNNVDVARMNGSVVVDHEGISGHFIVLNQISREVESQIVELSRNLKDTLQKNVVMVEEKRCLKDYCTLILFLLTDSKVGIDYGEKALVISI